MCKTSPVTQMYMLGYAPEKVEYEKYWCVHFGRISSDVILENQSHGRICFSWIVRSVKRTNSNRNIAKFDDVISEKFIGNTYCISILNLYM